MKYKLFKQNNDYYLTLTTGEAQLLTVEQVRALVLSFGSFAVEETAFVSFSIQFDESSSEHIASINDDNTLTLYSSAFLSDIFFDESAYVSVQEYAEIHGKKRAIVSRLCNDGRIPGAVRKGTKWYIPKNATYPKDCRAGRDMSKRYAHKKEND